VEEEVPPGQNQENMEAHALPPARRSPPEVLVPMVHNNVIGRKSQLLVENSNGTQVENSPCQFFDDHPQLFELHTDIAKQHYHQEMMDHKLSYLQLSQFLLVMMVVAVSLLFNLAIMPYFFLISYF
jgi:hypothetical protein